MRTSKFNVEQQRFALLVASAGWPVAGVCRAMGIARVTFYRWKKAHSARPALSLEARALLAALTAGGIEAARLEAALAVLADADKAASVMVAADAAPAVLTAPGGAAAVLVGADKALAVLVDAGAAPADRLEIGIKPARARRPRDVEGDVYITGRLQALAARNPRWGYRRLRQLLAQEGLDPGARRTYRLYMAAGLAVRPERMKRRRTGRVGKALPLGGRDPIWELVVANGRLSGGQPFSAWRIADAHTGKTLRVVVQPYWQRLAAGRVMSDLVEGWGVPLALHYGGDADLVEALEAWAVANEVVMRPLPDGGAAFRAQVQELTLASREQVRKALAV